MKDKKHKSKIKNLKVFSLCLWFLIFNFLFTPLAYAGFLDNFKSAAGLVQGFSGGIQGLRGSGASGSEVPVFNRAIEEVKNKEVGRKRLPIPGLGKISLPFPVPGSSDDSFAWNLANMAIHKISKEVVNWIRYGGTERGRKGTSGSLFVTNWEDFLKDVANEASGIFLEEFELTELCSPLKPQLRLFLGIGGGAPYYQRARCTIQDVARNVENFYRDFKQGGWTRWFQITIVPQNNFYGAYYMSLEEKLLREFGAVEASKSMAIAGGGFLGKEECVEWEKPKGPVYENPEDDPNFPNITPPSSLKCVKWRTVTPGTLVQDQLNQVFGGDLKRLEVADEIDEIVAAAFQRLFSELRKSQQGVLKGRGTPATPTKPATKDPIDQFNDDTKNEVSAAIQQVSNNLDLPEAIRLLEETGNVKQDSITKVNTLIGVLESINSCQGTDDESRINIAKDNIIQLKKDISSIATTTAQLIIGREELENAGNTDDVYQLFSDLKTAVDIVISLYDSAVAENNSIAGEITLTEQELITCQEQEQL